MKNYNIGGLKMANEVSLTGYADDSQIKKYLQNVMIPRVFKDIPVSVLNTGAFSIFSEYLSQALENLAFTSAYYFNESFITKAVMPDSIYAEAAIFNIGYAFATPSSTNILLELKIEDIMNNAKYNADSHCYEFILDKNTRFNLSNGNVYSLDYDILIQYRTKETATSGDKAWDIHYLMENDQNSIALNKNTYIMHRVTDVWLCLLLNVSEYQRSTYTIINTTMNGIPNADTVITTTGHICGFDIKYTYTDDAKQQHEEYIAKDHILPIHATVKDLNPYVHYIMDNSQTIRFMWQLNGSKYFIPKTNSSFDITIYTCHGEAANFSAFDNNDQPYVIADSSRYANNSNVLKAAFVLSGSLGGTDIGNAETVRRMTIEAYNTANVLSTDHDLTEWFKTLYFKNVLYPFFFKRRDDPWGRLWSGCIALKDSDDYVFKTNTLHGRISYDLLYTNNDNTVSNNEIIIPPGWIWKYASDQEFTVVPVTSGDNKTIEDANTFKNLNNDFIFANPFGMRIQKDPFAIGYFNPWINTSVTANKIKSTALSKDLDDTSEMYHAYPIATNISRTFKNNYYHLSSVITPTIPTITLNGVTEEMIRELKENATLPIYSESLWNYFKQPQDLYSSLVPFISLTSDDKYLPFDPTNTFLCVQKKMSRGDGTSTLSGLYIKEGTTLDAPTYELSIVGSNTITIGNNSLWEDSNRCNAIPVSGDTSITMTSSFDRVIAEDPNAVDPIELVQSPEGQYFIFKTKDGTELGQIEYIATTVQHETNIQKYGENRLFLVSNYDQPTTLLNVKIQGYEQTFDYIISNAEAIYIPYDREPEYDGVCWYRFYFNVGENARLAYAQMKPMAESGSIDHYEIRLSDIGKNEPAFLLENKILDCSKNNMRVILQAMLNGAEVGRIEMLPVTVNTDGSYQFEADAYPLNQLVDIDNRIRIASLYDGGGAWTATNGQSIVVDATKPEFKITILVRSSDPNHVSEIGNDPTYAGYIIADEYSLESFSLIQELKEMRSVVKFSDSAAPSKEAMELYNHMIELISSDPDEKNIYDIIKYITNVIAGTRTHIDEDTVRIIASAMETKVRAYVTVAKTVPFTDVDDEKYDAIKSSLSDIASWDKQYQIPSRDVQNFVTMYYYGDTMYEDALHTTPITPVANVFYNDIPTDDMYIQSYTEPTKVERTRLIIWEDQLNVLDTYGATVEETFAHTNVHSGLTIELMPFTEYSLLTSDRFPSFISSFTQVHKVLEPVIFDRLDGNDFLDTKLIATYGKPHSYTTEFHRDINDNVYWPDLSIQLEFDISLKNQSIATDTLTKLRSIVKSYFSKLTTIHTTRDQISMDNNIYITELIKLMLEEKSHNINYLKFVGWYTQDRYTMTKQSKFMDANTQTIVQRYQNIDDFPKGELERFIPEMFIVEDSNIIFNVL